MSPSRFSQKAINGLLIFVEACLERLKKERRQKLEEQKASIFE